MSPCELAWHGSSAIARFKPQVLLPSTVADFEFPNTETVPFRGLSLALPRPFPTLPPITSLRNPPLCRLDSSGSLTLDRNSKAVHPRQFALRYSKGKWRPQINDFELRLSTALLSEHN